MPARHCLREPYASIPHIFRKLGSLLRGYGVNYGQMVQARETGLQPRMTAIRVNEQNDSRHGPDQLCRRPVLPEGAWSGSRNSLKWEGSVGLLLLLDCGKD